MKKIFFSCFILLIVACIPSIVFAQNNTLPDSVDNVINLTEDITLLEKLTITDDVKINLNNHTLKLTKADNHFNANVTIENGTIDISGVSHNGDGILEIGNYGGTTGKLTFNNVRFKGESYNSSYAVIYVYGTSKFQMNNSTMNLNDEGSSAGGVIKAQGTSGEINIINSTLNFTNTIRGLLDGTVLISGSNVTIQGTKANGLDNAINTTSGGLALTLDNTTLNISNATGRGITLDNTALNIKNACNVNISNCNEGEIYVKTSGIINADNKSYIDAVISQRSGATGTIVVTGGNFKSEVGDEYLPEGYICKKVDNGYIIIKENTITVVKNIEAGEVKLSTSKAFFEDIVTLTISVNEGYKVEKIELIGLETNSKYIIENNQFTMPDEPVEVNVVFKEVKKEENIIDKEENVVDKEEAVENTTSNTEITENKITTNDKNESETLDEGVINGVIDVNDESIQESPKPEEEIIKKSNVNIWVFLIFVIIIIIGIVLWKALKKHE